MTSDPRMSAEPPETPPEPATTHASGHRSVAVGGGVRDSTIITGDSNTIIIGPRLPWRWVLVGLVAVLALGAAAYALYPRPIPIMTGDLNVGVAEFGALTPQGSVAASSDARTLADSFYASLGGELQQINQASGSVEQHFDIQLWGPAQVGRIDGATPAARAENAEKVATRGKIHLLVYGYLEPGATASTFVPQFYLRNLQNTPELEGEHDLGASVPVRSLDDPASRQQLRADLTGRTRAFAEFVIGLSQFTNDKYADARVHFLNAAADPQWDEGNGKEVLYLFLGYAEGSLRNLAAAREAFQRALTINPEFARAYLGFGEVQFQESLGKPDACGRDSVNVSGIQAAIQLYDRAARATTQPDGSNVPSWTALERGRAYLCLTQADAGDYSADAERELHVVIADYAAGNASAIDIAAEAHSNLGFVYLPLRCDPQRLDKYRRAAAEYQSAVDLSQFHPARQGFYYEMLGFINTQTGALDDARAAYTSAKRVDPTSRDHYDQLLQNIQAPPPEVCP
jgi:tetratricopeptide (TPR) repeat protein